MQQATILNFKDYYDKIHIRQAPKVSDKEPIRRKSYGLKSISEIKDVLDYMLNKGMYIHYLIFNVQFNTGRRISDVVGKKDTSKRKGKAPMKWSDFFEPNGQRKTHLIIEREQKTGKYKEVLINDALWKAIELYCELTGCDPARKNYNDAITLQLYGTHKGKPISYEGYRQALEKVEEECEIKRKFRSNSAKKSTGYLMKKIHPTDEFSTAVVSGFFNHSSEAVTRRYLGIDQEKEDEYVASIGKLALDVMEGKEIAMPDRPTDLVTIEYDDLRQIIQLIYQYGRENATENDLQKHLDNIDVAMEMIRDVMK